MTLKEAKVKAFETALTLPDDESADVVRIGKRRFEVQLNTVTPVKPVWVRTGWMARDDQAHGYGPTGDRAGGRQDRYQRVC